MYKEMQTSKSHDICELVPHVPGMHTLRIGCVLLWKFKNGIFEKNKAEFFAYSNHQEPGFDSNKSFSPVMGLESPRTFSHSLLELMIPPRTSWVA